MSAPGAAAAAAGADPSTLDSSVFCFADDVLASGPEAFCRELAASGFGGVTVAAAYHAAVDLRPRAGRITELTGGARYFADPVFGAADSLVPPPYASTDMLAALRSAADQAGISLTAWTVFCHDSYAGSRRPQLCQQTVFGDRLSTDLCPANPAVRDRVLALAAAVLRRRPDRLLAESLHFHPLRESRRFVPLDAQARLALGLCYCEHCLAAGSSAGVSPGQITGWARSAAERAFSGEARESAEPLTGGELAGLAGGAVAAFLEARCSVVTALVAEVAGLAREAGSALAMMDQAGTEVPALSQVKPAEARRYGVDTAALAGVVDACEVLAYGPSPQQAGADISSYRDAAGRPVTLRAALRPCWPDSVTEENLAAKIRAVRAAGASAVDFYHYGLASTDAFSRASRVLEQITG